MQRLILQVWSDIACPWCFVGKRRLEAALSRLDVGDKVAVRYRAFELDPSAPARYPERPSYVARLAKKYGLSEGRAAEMIERMQSVGQTEGIHFDFEGICAGSTFDAHRLLCSVSELDLQAALKERLMVAYFSEGRCMSDRNALVTLASEAGIAADVASSVLFSDAYRDEVREEQRSAMRLGVHGVPFFAIAQYGVSGAQPPELLQKVIARALHESGEPQAEAEVASPLVCDSSSCS